MKTKTSLKLYGAKALTFFVTNNNKTKRIFHDAKNWDIVQKMIDENFDYTEEQYLDLKNKFDKSS
jgi:hydroxymethylpyrimidine/phosphomethylpyrimidine kinase